jgi:ABC-2 type transport system ATP-binding protein
VMEKLLEARGLTIRFGTVKALDGLDLTARSGEVLGVLGPNGAGKSTLVRTIATLLRPDAGELRVAGIDVARDPVSVRREIGLAGQSAAVEPAMTGRENLEMTARLFGHTRAGARKAADAVIDQLSLGEVADRRSSTYSGGQRRRLDLGASLVGAPRLLLLDEPTTGLDPASRAEVWTAFRDLVARGTDVLLTTHYLDEADELADQIVVIDHGRTVAAGTPGELKASVGREVVEVVVTDHGQVGEAARILEQVTSGAPRLDHNGRRVTVRTTGGVGDLETIIEAFATAKVGVDEIGLRRPTLDEVFLTLTGEHAGGARPAADASTRNGDAG